MYLIARSTLPGQADCPSQDSWTNERFLLKEPTELRFAATRSIRQSQIKRFAGREIVEPVAAS